MQKKPWAKKEMRQQNVKKLRQALQSCGKGESESVEDFEQQILDKSRNMEEYLQNVAKVCVLLIVCVYIACVHYSLTTTFSSSVCTHLEYNGYIHGDIVPRYLRIYIVYSRCYHNVQEELKCTILFR